MVSILFKWSLLLSTLYFREDVKSVLRPLHPVFMSVTEIEHNARDKTLEISCKIFTDDFEKTLRKSYSGTVDLINPKNRSAMNNLVSGYIMKHLQIIGDGKQLALEFIGYEQQEEGITSFYQVNNIPKLKKLDITDNILYEYKKEQFSIIHVTVKGNRKSNKLVNPDDKLSLEF